MKLIFKRQDLSRVLRLCKNVMSSKPIMPFDSLMTFTVKDKKCRVSASNAGRMDVTAFCSVIGEDCKFALEGSKIFNLVNALEGEEIAININKKSVTISQDKKKHKMSVVKDDFTTYKSSKYTHLDKENCIDLKGAMFEYALYNASRLVDDNEIREAFRGIGILKQGSKENVMIIGLGNEASVFQFVDAKHGSKTEDINVILPKQSASVIHSLGMVQDERVLLYYDKKSGNVVLKTDEIILFASTLTGEIPGQAMQLLDQFKSFEKTNVSRSEIQSMINRTVSITNKKEKVSIAFRYRDYGIDLLGFGDENFDNCAYDYVKSSKKLAVNHVHKFNSKYIRKPFDFIQNEEVKIGISTEKNPIMFVTCVNPKVNMAEYYMVAGLFIQESLDDQVVEVIDSF